MSGVKPIPWRELLSAAGFTDYQEYLKSAHWRAFKATHLRVRSNRLCFVCWKKPVEIHHRTYRRLGSELPEDVVSLCGGCHERLHKEGESSSLSLPDFTAQFIEKNRRYVPLPPPVNKNTRRIQKKKKLKQLEVLRRARKKARREKRRMRDKRVFGGNWVMRGGHVVFSP